MGCWFDGNEFSVIRSLEPNLKPNYYYTFLPEYSPPPTLTQHATVTDESELEIRKYYENGGTNAPTSFTYAPRSTRRTALPFPFWSHSYIPLLNSFIQILQLERYNVNVTTQLLPLFLFTRKHIPRDFQETKQIVNNLGAVPCLAGSKDQQLQCRKEFATAQGCDYVQLNVQPAQYDLKDLDQCHSFFIRAQAYRNKSYILKPIGALHGDGQEVYLSTQHGEELKERFSQCITKHAYVIMDYIDNPATMMGGYKFDFRTFLLVASLRPLMAFQYEDGVVRRSKHKFTLKSNDRSIHIMNTRDQTYDDHLFGFDALHKALQEEMGLPANHFSQAIAPQLNLVAKFLVATQFTVRVRGFRFPRGRYQVFALDWVLDRAGNVHFLEANGYPALFEYTRIGMSSDMWPACVELIDMLHLRPQMVPKNMATRHGYVYKKWKLVYNYIEEKWERDRGRGFNACEAFKL